MPLLSMNKHKMFLLLPDRKNVRKSEDGTLAEASFEYTWGIGAVGNNTGACFQRDNRVFV